MGLRKPNRHEKEDKIDSEGTRLVEADGIFCGSLKNLVVISKISEVAVNSDFSLRRSEAICVTKTRTRTVVCSHFVIVS